MGYKVWGSLLQQKCTLISTMTSLKAWLSVVPRKGEMLDQWFLTGGTRTPYPLGVRSTKTRGTNHQIFCGIHALKFKPRHARSENLKNVFSIVVSAVNFIRGHALNHRVFKVFCNEVGDQHSVLFHTEMRWLSRVRVLTRVWAVQRNRAVSETPK